MPAKRYFVNLSQEEKEELRILISSGKSRARVQTRARVLLLCDEHSDWSDKKVAQALLCSVPTVERTRKRCVEESFKDALYDKKRNRVYERKLNALAEAHLVTLACSTPPEGRSVWKMFWTFMLKNYLMMRCLFVWMKVINSILRKQKYQYQ